MNVLYFVRVKPSLDDENNCRAKVQSRNSLKQDKCSYWPTISSWLIMCRVKIVVLIKLKVTSTRLSYHFPLKKSNKKLCQGSQIKKQENTVLDNTSLKCKYHKQKKILCVLFLEGSEKTSDTRCAHYKVHNITIIFHSHRVQAERLPCCSVCIDVCDGVVMRVMSLFSVHGVWIGCLCGDWVLGKSDLMGS